MANKRSQASSYPSRYGKSRFVTAAQFLAEVMCERRARAEKKTLPPEFWKDAHWKKVYLQQVTAANRLIKRFDQQGKGTGAAAISAFLRSERGKACYSLLGAWVVPLIEVAHKAAVFRQEVRQHESPASAVEEEGLPLPAGPRQAFVGKQSVLQKLKRLEDG